MEQHIRKAFEGLRMAQDELMRPNDDAVALCACQCTREAACNFFLAYLRDKTPGDFSDSTLADLQYQCAKVDSHFNVIDLSCFECRNAGAGADDQEYCLSVEKVHGCFQRANAIRELVMAKLKLRENDFLHA